MQPQGRRVGAAGGHADGILAIDGAAGWKIRHPSPCDIHSDGIDEAETRESNRVIRAFKAVRGARQKWMSAGDRAQNNPAAGPTGRNRHAVRAGEHRAAAHVQGADADVVIQVHDAAGTAFVDRQCVEGRRTGNRRLKTAEQCHRTGPGLESPLIDPVAEERNSVQVGAEGRARSDGEVAIDCQRARGGLDRIP